MREKREGKVKHYERGHTRVHNRRKKGFDGEEELRRRHSSGEMRSHMPEERGKVKGTLV